MKITFNLLDCGLANNGGSDTIVKSANTLVELGHKVYIVDDIPCSYTWEPIKAEQVMIHSNDDVPYADVVISTGFKTVIKALGFPKQCGKQYHWIRGWETWTYPEAYITSTILKYPVTRFVNSIQLQHKLASHGVKSHVIRPGYDIEEAVLLNERDDKDRIFLGGIYCSGKKRAGKRTEWILEAAARLKREYDISLWMYGLNECIDSSQIDSYFQNPVPVVKNWMYNQVDIWLSPTELEGLHRPPAEAMLTECPVVGTSAHLSGMGDYLRHNETGLVADNNIESFIKHVRQLIDDKKLRIKLGRQARQAVIALGDREHNMQLMVEGLGGKG